MSWQEAILGIVVVICITATIIVSIYFYNRN